MKTFTPADIRALASRASMAGDHALASLLWKFSERQGPHTDYLIRTAAAELLTEGSR